METKEETHTSYFLTKEEIIEKFEIVVGPDEDTWSYYRDNVLEIKIVPMPEPASEEDPVPED